MYIKFLSNCIYQLSYFYIIIDKIQKYIKRNMNILIKHIFLLQYYKLYIILTNFCIHIFQY